MSLAAHHSASVTQAYSFAPPSKICHHSLLTTCTQSLIVLCNAESCERRRGERVKKKNKNTRVGPRSRSLERRPCDIRWRGERAGGGRQVAQWHEEHKGKPPFKRSQESRSARRCVHTFIESCVHRRRHMAASRTAEQKKKRWMESRREKRTKTGMEKEGAAY